jgi:hypothetical protein
MIYQYFNLITINNLKLLKIKHLIDLYLLSIELEVQKI